MIAAERRLVAEANGPDGSVSEQVQHPTDRGGAQMITEETIACSPAAWRTKHGDRGDVPLADDVQFTGPVASFDSADGFGRLGARGWRGRDRLRGFARSSSTATPSPRSSMGDGDSGSRKDDFRGAGRGDPPSPAANRASL
jgi:hypothetical protein